jgi:hypothetical protein
VPVVPRSPTAWPYPNSYPNQLAATISVNE